MTDSYESPALLRQYLDFHYRSGEAGYLPYHPDDPGLREYPQRCAEKLIAHCRHFNRALDLGCAVGGASFRLAQHFAEVVGVDASCSFIDTANTLAENGVFRVSESSYRPPSETRKCSPAFQTGDACDPDPALGVFDGILLANLLCRLPDPAACLRALQAHTHSGTVLVITTPCSWDEAFTPREKWLTPTLEGLHQHLAPWCSCLEVSEIPFLLRDHPRRAQYTIAQSSVWQVT